MIFVIVTGMSGAGKSLAIKHMEDLGFFCVDNLPPSLIPKFAEICFQSKGRMKKIALVIDIRGGELLKDLFPGLAELKDAGFSYQILFLDASDKVLIKRFKESRRLHPLSTDGRIVKGIKDERRILREIKSKADHIIDTSELFSRQLKEELVEIFSEGQNIKGLIISIVSFGFKYGVPMDCDLIFDVRFLPNPYYIESMKRLTGKDKSVKDYVLSSEVTTLFLEKLKDMIDFLLPNYVKEGKSQLVVGIGCTGGQHRSVAIADEIYNAFHDNRYITIIEHRDIDKHTKKGR